MAALESEIEGGVHEGFADGGFFGVSLRLIDGQDFSGWIEVDFGFDDALGFNFVEVEEIKEEFGIGDFEVVEIILHLAFEFGGFVGHVIGPHEAIPERVLAVNHEAESFGSVGDFGTDGVAFDSAHLLEECKLADFGPIEPDFPADSGGTGSLRFPVVFDEANVVAF